MLKLFVWFYAAIVLLITVWTWGVEITMHESTTEHLLPSFLLEIATMPLSLLVTQLMIKIPPIAVASLAPLVILTLAGLMQAGGLIAAYILLNRKRVRA